MPDFAESSLLIMPPSGVRLHTKNETICGNMHNDLMLKRLIGSSLFLLEMNVKRVWMIGFFFSLSIGLLIQLFILPILFPFCHAGHGLLAGNDVIRFHTDAVLLAGLIQDKGWGEWVLRPGGQAPSGIMAVAYVFFPDEPFVVLPLYAALFATSIALLFAILRLCGFEKKAAGFGILPLLFFPSGALLYAVPHKDAFYFCGNILFFYGLLRMAISVTSEPLRAGEGFLPLCGFFVISLAGAFLVWVVRPYGVEIMMGTGGLIALIASGIFWVGSLQRSFRGGRGAWKLTVLWFLIVLIKPMEGGRITIDTDMPILENPGVEMESGGTKTPLLLSPDTIATPKIFFNDDWTASDYLPLRFELLLQRLVAARNRYLNLHSDAASAIDRTTSFRSVWEMAAYLPRAFSIGLFAPFPSDWWGQGSVPTNTLLRRFSAVEMIVWYFFSPLCFLALLRGPARLPISLLQLYAVSTILVMVIALPNVGTLYRIRFGFWIMLFSVAAAMAATMLERRRSTCVG